MSKNNHRRIPLYLINVIFFLVFIFPRFVYADTHTVGPNDCSAAAVNAAINAASDGDTVELTCTGTVDWNAKVIIPDTKGITLKVAGAYNNWKTGSSNFPLTISSNKDPIIEVNCENNKSLTRISGFKLRNTISSNYGAVYVQGRGTGTTGLGAFRIDNNYFDQIHLPEANLEGTITVNASTGELYGVIDHNTLYDTSWTDGYGIALWESWKVGGSSWSYAGNGSWIRNFTFGDANFVFIENNLFQNVNRYTRHYIEASTGARYVARYNKFDTNQDYSGNQTEQTEAHGLCICESTGRGTRGGEIYNNEYTGSEIGVPIHIRGGWWLIYDNTFTANGWRDTPISLRDYRTSAGSCDDCEATCDGISGWRACVNNGSYYPLAEQIQNTYVWRNTLNGTPTTASVPDDGVQLLYLQEGRDYWNVSSLADAKAHGLSAGYAAYTYPHPLTVAGTGTGSPPQPPTNLRVIP